MGTLSPDAFYAALKERSEKCLIPLIRYPAFDQYITYVLLSQEIQPDKIFNELKGLEENAYEQLAKSDDEKELVREFDSFLPSLPPWSKS